MILERDYRKEKRNICKSKEKTVRERALGARRWLVASLAYEVLPYNLFRIHKNHSTFDEYQRCQARAFGADAFLIGGSLMKQDSTSEKLTQLLTVR
jgi:hypothetical protein